MSEKGFTVGALKYAELNYIRELAESILDAVASMKAGREHIKGYLLRVNDDDDIEIVKEVNFKLNQRKYEIDEQGKTKEV